MKGFNLPFQLVLVSILTAFFASCNNSQPHAPAEQTKPAAEKTVTVKPVETDAPLTNPYSGWGIWLGKRYFDGRVFTKEYNTTGFGDDAPLFTWAAVDWMWADLEPEKGRFDWAEFDSVLDYWKSRNKQLVIRIWVTDDPGWAGAPGSTACPDWIWKEGLKYHEYQGEANSVKREPDYAHPSFDRVYLPHLKRFLESFAKRYQKPESNMTMFQVMGYGQWGEWHTLWSNYPWPDKETKHQVLSNIARQYAAVFDSTQLAIAYCYDTDQAKVTSVDDFVYRQGLNLAVANHFCLTRHGFIDGLLRWDKGLMEKSWHHCPMLAEGDWSYLDVKNHGSHGTIEQNLDMMLEWHSVYAHFYTDAASYRRFIKEDTETLERGLKAGGLGYRFAITSATWEKEITAGRLLVLRQTWVNRNVGWCVRNFPLRIYLTDKEGNEKFSAKDEAFDNTHWYKGEEYPNTSIVMVSKKLPAGEYDVRVAMVDGSGKPAVKLGMEGIDPQGRYKLGTIQLLPPNPKDTVFWQ